MANYKKSDSWLEILLLISILQNSWKWFLPWTAQGVSDDLITSNGLKVTEEKISRDSSKMLLISWFADKGVDKSIWRCGKSREKGKQTMKYEPGRQWNSFDYQCQCFVKCVELLSQQTGWKENTQQSINQARKPAWEWFTLTPNRPQKLIFIGLKYDWQSNRCAGTSNDFIVVCVSYLNREEFLCSL